MAENFYSPTEEGWLKKAKALDEQLVRQQDLKMIDLHTTPDVILHADQITLNDDLKVHFSLPRRTVPENISDVSQSCTDLV